jgi:hypothetical protein
MKKQIFMASIVTLAILFASCGNEEVTPVANEVTNTELRGAAPIITTIGGSTILDYFREGRWLGNVKACGSGSFYGYYVINTENSSDGYNYWTINGSNFGSAQGTVSSNSSAITFQIISWSNTSIKVRPIAPYVLDYKDGLNVIVKKSTNETGNSIVNVIGMLANGRGFGQCTWEAAFQRKQMGLGIPPSAYTATGNISASYTPKKGDVLDWAASHTGIIMTNPITTTANGVTTYSFILRERNQNCNEKTATQTTQSFKRSSTAIIQGISSANAGLGKVTKYFR